KCILLYSFQDKFIQEFFIDKLGEEHPELDQEVLEKRKEHARRKLDLVIHYARTHICRRQMIMDYFGDETEVAGCQCDVCLRGQHISTDAPRPAAVIPDETITLIRQLLSAIARMHRK